MTAFTRVESRDASSPLGWYVVFEMLHACAMRANKRALSARSANRPIQHVQRMRELVVKEHEDKKEARTMRIERQVKAKQAAALRKLSLTHHHLDD